jgi:type 1 glutamine amidotransferase
MARNLILTGGVVHPFDTAAPALARVLAAHGIESTISEDFAAGLADLAAGKYDLLTIYALRWTMGQSERYAVDRARWALSLDAPGRRAITAHVERGGGLLGVHTASICFDDWPDWQRILGGAWIWGRSGHPPYGPVEVRFDAPDHPLLRGLTPFTLDDEVYGDLALEPDVVPLMHARAGTGGAWQPMLWERQVGAGRVIYDALGHDAASLTHPVHRRIVARAALQALGADAAALEAA